MFSVSTPSHLTTLEAARVLRCTPDHVATLLRRRILSGQKRGRDWLVERAEIERSLRWKVLPLIARCESDLRRVENTSPSLDGEAQQRTAAEKSHILAILEEARQRRREHEQALAELGTAIGGLQREQELLSFA